jgi:deoxyribodipyrimidine photo-lyase
LLDGDLPSNHLSWQWVASSFSSKPYLFNADNVAKYAPQSAFKAWISKGTVIDTSYEALDDLARTHGDVGAEPGVRTGVQENLIAHNLEQIRQFAGIESARNATEFIVILLSQAKPETRIELIHPWNLQPRSDAQHLRIGIIHTPAHEQHAWSEPRWRFVMQRMKEVCDCVWIGNITELAKLPSWPGQERITSQASLFVGYRDALPHIAQLTSAPKLFAHPTRLCNSFSKFYEQARKAEHEFSRLLELPQQSSLL